MTSDQQVLFNNALALPESERIRLAELLLDSLSPTHEDLAEEGWKQHTDAELLAELERRRREVQLGTVRPIPGSEFNFDNKE